MKLKKIIKLRINLELKNRWQNGGSKQPTININTSAICLGGERRQ
jgi:hypothetical protein